METTSACCDENDSLNRALEALEADVSLQHELNRLCSAGEPLSDFDSPNFSIVDYINRTCPDEAHLSSVDLKLKELRDYVSTLQEQIQDALQKQMASISCVEQDFMILQKSGAELTKDLQAIQCQAAAAEEHIDATWHDITTLDRGRTNLNTTIASLKRLAMLVTALDELRCICAERRYDQAAHLVEAANQLAACFEKHVASPRIQELLHEHQTFLNDLRAQLLEDFEALFDTDTPPLKTLVDACRVADAISSSFRKEILDRFTQRYLDSYHAAFPSRAAVAQPLVALETLDRRFLWFKKQFREFSSRYGIHFLESWGLLRFISVRFCTVLRTQLVDILGVTHVDPTLLVRALQKTKDFERFLADHFEDVSPGNATHLSEMLTMLETRDRFVDSSIVNQVLQYPDVLREDAAVNLAVPSAAPAQSPSVRFTFNGAISQCFDAFMMPWVRAEEKRLQSVVTGATERDQILFDQAATCLQDEGWTSGTKTLYTSAIDILAAIKTAFQRCSGISTGQPLADIVAVFQRTLLMYTNILETRCSSLKTGTDETGQEDILAALLGTVEYIECTLPHLTQAVSSTLDDNAQVTFSEQQDALLNVKSNAMTRLSSLLYPRVEVQLRRLSQTDWVAVATVADESPWVRDLIQTLKTFFASMEKKLSSMLFRLFCDTFLQFFTAAYRSSIYASKQLSELGAQQLLLDTHAVKTALHDLPAVVANGTSPIYSKVLLREFRQLEMLLKILSSTASTPTETLLTLLTEDAGITSPEELRATLHLRASCSDHL